MISEKNSVLVDSIGRRMRKLRISLLDNCHFRCLYCMPRDIKFLNKNEWLSERELLEICGNLLTFGLEEFRLTGGEPTLRPDLIDIVQSLSTLPVKKFGMTSNGEQLLKLLPDLKKGQCLHLNISLDTLQEKKFLQITQSMNFGNVMDSILAAKEMGFHVKVNTVLMKGVNDEEVMEFIKFSARTGIEVRFLELMKIGVANQKYEKWFVPAGDILQRLEREWTLAPISQRSDSTSFNFQAEVDGGLAQVGFIASESRPFCGTCSRLRLTPQGVLRACLMKTDGLSLRGVLLEDYNPILEKVLGMKPYDRVEKIEQPMYQIGG